ncbi:permease prefix domain 1-containing protein [Microbacterium sp. NIBRBAC000506063]|uniref:permease prefix domain 1-containing protein n=1 Tax=Microbacterium sp. NIBRBAC000506063 TaxID=2734618 RepID=UPI002948B94D|nr:permease prefix domain 1-containing protein [Microbacterium sp. NIBRBAC000506063]
MQTTLTQRYISAVTRRLPADMQDDVREELAASVADAVESRLEQGEEAADAERAVLTGLGDPDALAAGYADRPLHLIGPRYYLMWWRLLKLLLWIVPACVLGAVILGLSLAGAPVGEIIGTAVAATVGTIVHLAFWTTLVFAILDRTGADATIGWDLDHLPEPQETGAGRGELIASLVLLGVAAAALLWDRFIGFVFRADGDVNIGAGLGEQTTSLPLLDPGLWPWWLGGLLVLLAVEAVLAVVLYARAGGTARWRR